MKVAGSQGKTGYCPGILWAEVTLSCSGVLLPGVVNLLSCQARLLTPSEDLGVTGYFLVSPLSLISLWLRSLWFAVRVSLSQMINVH